MAWVLYNHADIDRYHPRPLGQCDRCGFIYNRDRLNWQYETVGVKPMNLRVLVCRKCMDEPQEQLKTLIIPIDPPSILNPRPGEFSGEMYSSSPEIFYSVVPTEIVQEVFQYDQTDPLAATTIGNRTPIVTETSSLPLLTEITVTPNPDPNYGGTIDSSV